MDWVIKASEEDRRKELIRRRKERLLRSSKRLEEVKRLSYNSNHLHALSLLQAVSATKVAKHQDRLYWISFAKWRLKVCQGLR